MSANGIRVFSLVREFFVRAKYLFEKSEAAAQALFNLLKTWVDPNK
jgi:hypothetical protein